MAHQTRSTRHWTAALPLLAIDAGLLLVLSLIVLLHPGPSPVSAAVSQPSPTFIATVVAAPPAPSSTQAVRQVEPTSSPSPTSTTKASVHPTPSAPVSAGHPVAAPACRAKDLSGRIIAWDGAAGSRIAELELRNTANEDCTMAAPTALRLIAADGAVLIDSSKIAGDPSTTPDEPALTVAPGASIRTDVRVANYCGPTPKAPIGVSLSLAGSTGAVVAMPAPGLLTDDAVPPCNGPIGAEIEMNGWRQ